MELPHNAVGGVLHGRRDDVAAAAGGRRREGVDVEPTTTTATPARFVVILFFLLKKRERRESCKHSGAGRTPGWISPDRVSTLCTRAQRSKTRLRVLWSARRVACVSSGDRALGKVNEKARKNIFWKKRQKKRGPTNFHFWRHVADGDAFRALELELAMVSYESTPVVSPNRNTRGGSSRQKHLKREKNVTLCHTKKCNIITHSSDFSNRLV